jgi:uncharacterized protein (DUF58 family)
MQAGSSLELQDFREYQPGDDLRQIDWNAVARTGRLILRVRREEIAPRIEILVDASRSMAVSEAKRERTRELALLLLKLAAAEGQPAALYWLGAQESRTPMPLESFDGACSLSASLERVPLRACGVRLVISDLLFEAPLAPLFRRLSDGAGMLGLVQLLDRQDEEPDWNGEARLIDSETGAEIERHLDAEALALYRSRLQAHQSALDLEARRVRAILCRMRADEPLESQLRERLAGKLLVARAAA